MAQSRRLALTIIAGFLSVLRGTPMREINPIITCNGYLPQTSQSASLVCHYNKDLTDKAENFMIKFCGQNPECVEAMSCNWENTSHGLHCVPGPTFEEMSCTVTDLRRGDLTCQLPNVRPHHSGCYACHLVPPDGRAQQSCAVIVPWEKEKDEEKSNSAHEWLQTTILIVLLAVVIVTIVFFIRQKLMKRQRRESPGSGLQNQDPSQNQNRTPASAGGMTESQGREPQPDAGQDGPQDGAESQRRSPGNEGRTENPVSSQNPSSTSIGTMTENTERVPHAQSEQDVASHDETYDKNVAEAEATKPLLSRFRSNSMETRNKPPKVGTPSIVFNFSKNTYTTNVWVPDRDGKRILQSPQDPGISKDIDSSIAHSEVEASSSLTDPVNEETPKKKME